MTNKPINDFLDESREWHAFGLGVWRAWMPLNVTALSDDLKSDIKIEYHYHLLGYWAMRFIQSIALIVIGILL